MAFNPITFELDVLNPLYDEFKNWVGVKVKPGQEESTKLLLKAVTVRVMGFINTPLEGLDGIPMELQGLIYTVAARYHNNPRGVSQQSAASYSESFPSANTQGIVFTKDEKTLMGRYRSTPNGLGTLSTYREESPRFPEFMPYM